MSEPSEIIGGAPECPDPEAECARLRAALIQIRNKVHAHNRGGELYAGLRNVIRDICDEALRGS